MERIKESILIKRPVNEVFRFLEAVEPRLRLNPSYKLRAFKKLTSGPISKGTRFRITFETSRGISEYESEVVEFRDNELIKTRDTRGRLCLTLSVKPLTGGTLLTHDEEFMIPKELLDDEDETVHDWRDVFKHLLHLDRVRFIDHEKEKKIANLKEDLKEKLREWLRRIKGYLEGELCV